MTTRQTKMKLVFLFMLFQATVVDAKAPTICDSKLKSKMIAFVREYENKGDKAVISKLRHAKVDQLRSMDDGAQSFLLGKSALVGFYKSAGITHGEDMAVDFKASIWSNGQKDRCSELDRAEPMKDPSLAPSRIEELE